jgi:hypothetical protein
VDDDDDLTSKYLVSAKTEEWVWDWWVMMDAALIGRDTIFRGQFDASRLGYCKNLDGNLRKMFISLIFWIRVQ